MKYGINNLTFISPFTNECVKYFGDYARMGFDIFEIAVETTDLDLHLLKKKAAEAGIELAVAGAFGPGRDMSSFEKDIRANGVSYTKYLIDMANELESFYIEGPMYSAVGKARQITEEEKAKQYALAVENVGICAEYAKRKGVRLGVEPLNRFETDFMNTVSQALTFIDNFDRAVVGLHLDNFHMNIEEVSISDAIMLAKNRIFGFHSCANDRGTPGRDHIDWQGIKKAFEAANYNDSLIIESFTSECKEIAKAASVWRSFAESPQALASDGLKFLKSVFG